LSLGVAIFALGKIGRAGLKQRPGSGGGVWMFRSNFYIRFGRLIAIWGKRSLRLDRRKRFGRTDYRVFLVPNVKNDCKNDEGDDHRAPS
jgi:hypothetical protein